MGWGGVGWGGMGWDGMGWDGMDGMGWDGMGSVSKPWWPPVLEKLECTGKKYVYLNILEYLKFLFFSSTVLEKIWDVLECTGILFTYYRILANFAFKKALHIPYKGKKFMQIGRNQFFHENLISKFTVFLQKFLPVRQYLKTEKCTEKCTLMYWNFTLNFPGASVNSQDTKKRLFENVPSLATVIFSVIETLIHLLRVPFSAHKTFLGS